MIILIWDLIGDDEDLITVEASVTVQDLEEVAENDAMRGFRVAVACAQTPDVDALDEGSRTGNRTMLLERARVDRMSGSMLSAKGRPIFVP